MSALAIEHRKVGPWTSMSAIEDLELRSRTVRIFEDIDGNYDVCILAARRLACVYHLLVANGLDKLGVSVFSDRDIGVQADLEWLAGKRILVIDDSIVVGSTITELVARIREIASDSHIKVRAVCVDKGQVSPVLYGTLPFDSDWVPVERESADVSRYSAQLAQAIFSGQIPYFSDFLTTELTTIGADRFFDATHCGPWGLSDVTARAMSSLGCGAFTFTPSREASHQILRRLSSLDERLAAAVEILKIRVLLRSEGYTVAFRAVAIATLRPTSAAQLDSMYKHVLGNEMTDSLSESQPGMKAMAHFRVLQAIAGAAVMRAFADDYNLELSPVDTSKGSRLEVDFGPILLPHLTTGVELLNTVDDSTTDDADREIPNTNIRWPSAEPYKEPLAIVRRHFERLSAEEHELASPSGRISYASQLLVGPIGQIFSLVDGAYERRQRRVLRELDDVDEYVRLLSSQRVLKRGITFGDLRALAKTADQELGVSQAIDVCNDIGICVPTTVYEDSLDAVAREYRLGENAYLAKFPFDAAGQRVPADAATNPDSWIVQSPRQVTLSPLEPLPIPVFSRMEQIGVHAYCDELLDSVENVGTALSGAADA